MSPPVGDATEPAATRLALRLRPQQGAQYERLVHALAEPELEISPVADHLDRSEVRVLGSAPYLVATLAGDASIPDLLPTLGRLGAVSDAFELIDNPTWSTDPLLRALPSRFTPFVADEMAEVRRYKGKTSDVFTRILLNVAIFGGAFRLSAGERLRVFDPLSGGGTTVFAALARGYDAIGLESNKTAYATTVEFVRKYLQNERVSYRERRERRDLGERFVFSVGPEQDARVLALMHGDARVADRQLRGLPDGGRVHAIVADLPYGIQHGGDARSLLIEAVPAWARSLRAGGSMALAWDATRIPRPEVIDLIERVDGLRVRTGGPFDRLEHQVDRVIKRRDVVVAVADG